MFAKIINIFMAFSIVACYPLYAIGQLWLFYARQKEPDFYNNINNYGSDWINAHLILMLALVLMIPAYIVINNFLKDNQYQFWADLSIFFIVLWAFVLFGQFTIDLCLAEIFSLPKEIAYEMVDKIQANSIIQALFYDNSKAFFLFKYFSLWLLAQICLGIALVRSKKIPKWVWIVFFIAVLVTEFGMLAGPTYGRIIKRSGYALFAIAFLPIVINLIRNTKTILPTNVEVK